MLLERLKNSNEAAVGEVNNRCQFQPAQPAATPFRERRHAEFFEVIGSSLKINTPDEFCNWAKTDLQHVFPYGILICGIGVIQNQSAEIHHLLSCNLSSEYIQTLHQNGGMGASPVFSRWVKTRQPVLFELFKQHNKTAWLENFKLHGLVNMAAHGQCDLNSDTTSYFSFSQIPGSLTLRHANMLEMLVPHLHVALIRAFQAAKKETSNPEAAVPVLSEREQEILKWLSAGKTNWEIAQVLKISENTVKNHVQRILIKLKVNTRAQAVSKRSITA